MRYSLSHLSDQTLIEALSARSTAGPLDPDPVEVSTPESAGVFTLELAPGQVGTPRPRVTRNGAARRP